MRSCHVTWNTPRWTQILTWRDHNRGYRKFYAEDEAHWIKHSNLCQWRLQKQSKIKIKNTDTQTENKVANVVFTTPLSLQENLYLLAFAKFERERERSNGVREDTQSSGSACSWTSTPKENIKHPCVIFLSFWNSELLFHVESAFVLVGCEKVLVFSFSFLFLFHCSVDCNGVWNGNGRMWALNVTELHLI